MLKKNLTDFFYSSQSCCIIINKPGVEPVHAKIMVSVEGEVNEFTIKEFTCN